MELESDEVLAMIDSGAFTHAVNAERHLPGHPIKPPTARELRRRGETACGGILEIKGSVEVDAEADGQKISLKFLDMDVNTPILSVRKLVADGCEVSIYEHGGHIHHLQSGRKMKFFEWQGVYYIKLRIKDMPDFTRPGR